MKTQHSFGSYIAHEGILHALDARVKICAFLALCFICFCFHSAFTVCMTACLLIVCCACAHMPLKTCLHACIPAGVVVLFVLIANTFVFGSDADIYLIAAFGISYAGFVRGFLAVLRILILLGFSLVVCATTKIKDLVDACIWFLTPLKRFGFPLEAFAIILSMMIRFIPLCSEEIMRIRQAQIARGVIVQKGSIIQTISQWSTIFVPLIVSLFQKADTLAQAMLERGYHE